MVFPQHDASPEGTSTNVVRTDDGANRSQSTAFENRRSRLARCAPSAPHVVIFKISSGRLPWQSRREALSFTLSDGARMTFPAGQRTQGIQGTQVIYDDIGVGSAGCLLAGRLFAAEPRA
jgi:hypothetical protein